ncbi:hypothetical protein HYH02_004588 [Chlamydomonas schloesseri]|uniref:Uncharacterized protein n=1 Tax=Chlamydomonas schloesseri TaxID=2026947 RepID=A0A835WPS2_9CHLO|nr:hypothetical protein HYH02_004588 [Chlamydomonas schloesseri]|eukprot:KAG2450751.1 hypothetical protein HYH02_004588 [Chlamydomonas schloesseri]
MPANAVAACTAGRSLAAEPWVAGLGYRWRLSDAVWAACAGGDAADGGGGGGGGCNGGGVGGGGSGSGGSGSPPQSQPQPQPKPQPPLVCDGALPPPLLERLAAAFAATTTNSTATPAAAASAAATTPSPFWAQHRYGRSSTPFFSYLYRLDQPPASVVEAAAQHLHSALLQGLLPPLPAPPAAAVSAPAVAAAAAGQQSSDEAAAGAGAQSWDEGAEAARGVAAALRRAAVVEWWAHTREPGAAHQLHFDVNEDVLRRGLSDYRLQHPLLSSVLFLPPPGPEPPSGSTTCGPPRAQEGGTPSGVAPVGGAGAVGGGGSAAAGAGSSVAAPAAAPAAAAGPAPAGNLQYGCVGGPTLVLDQTPAGARQSPPATDTAAAAAVAAAVGAGAAGAAASDNCLDKHEDEQPQTQQQQQQQHMAPRAWAVPPRPNRLLLFPGDLLHGVLPQAVAATAAVAAEAAAPEVPGMPETGACSGSPAAVAAADAAGGQTQAQRRGCTAMGAPAAADEAGMGGQAPPPPQQQQQQQRRTSLQRRTTLILAWWGPERALTASPAPPLVLAATRRRQRFGGCAGGHGAGRGDRCELSSDGIDSSRSSSTSSSDSSSSSSSSSEADTSGGDSGSERTAPGGEGDAGGRDGSSTDRSGGNGGSSKVGSVWEWRHAGQLRPGMLLQPQPQPQAHMQEAPVLEHAGKRRRLTAPNAATAASAATATTAANADCGCDADGKHHTGADGAKQQEAGRTAAAAPARRTTTTPGTGQLAQLPPPTWVEAFAVGRDGAAPLTAAAACASGGEGKVRQDGSGSACGLRWHVPRCVAPAWVRVKQLPTLEQQAKAQAQAQAGAEVQAQAGAEVQAQAGAEVQAQAGGGEEEEVWTLGRQAARGMALVLGEEPWDDGWLLLPKDATARQLPASAVAGAASAGAAGKEAMAGAAVAAAGGEEEAVPPALGRVLRALQPPELRLFLRTPHDLSDLYLPPAAHSPQ